MMVGNLMLAALLAASTPVASEMMFQGHAIEVEGAGDAARLLRVRGVRYAIPGTPTQIIGKAQACLSRRDSGAGIVSVDPVGGRLAAVSRVEYHDEPSVRLARSWLTVEAGPGNFSVELSKLGIRQGGSTGADATEEIFSPFLLRADAVWKPAVAAVIEVEQSLVDCMFN